MKGLWDGKGNEWIYIYVYIYIPYIHVHVQTGWNRFRLLFGWVLGFGIGGYLEMRMPS